MTAEGKEKFQLGKMTSIDDNDYVDLYGCATSPNDVNSNIQTGCYNAVKQVIENHLGLVIGIGVGIALLELLIIIFSCWLSCCYNKEDEDDYRYEKPMSTMEEETANI
ncbi:uncharacterized protein LOC106180702 [Lingula anatina]|nr:uncharacterized protein LOC106180702 [Lingula anatina]|eukprot:XP_013420235.1 uncharacterized protein LOC106180702 [Lingula anatina]